MASSTEEHIRALSDAMMSEAVPFVAETVPVDLFDDTVVPMEVPQQQNNVPSTSTLDYLHMAADEKDPLVSPPPLDRSNSGNKKKNVKKSESGDAGGKDNTITLSRARRERKRSRVFEDAADELSESSSDDLADTPPKKKQKTQAELADAVTRAVSESDLAGMAQFLHIEFIMAKRYNVESKQQEYLVKWRTVDIGYSKWVVRAAVSQEEQGDLDRFDIFWDKHAMNRKNKRDNFEKGLVSEIALGDQVWVKLRGHPWCPAQVVRIEPKPNGHHAIFVHFYGDHTFSWLRTDKPQEFVLMMFNEKSRAKLLTSETQSAVEEGLHILTLSPEMRKIQNTDHSTIKEYILRDSVFSLALPKKIDSLDEVIDWKQTSKKVKAPATPLIIKLPTAVVVNELQGQSYHAPPQVEEYPMQQQYFQMPQHTYQPQPMHGPPTTVFGSVYSPQFQMNSYAPHPSTSHNAYLHLPTVYQINPHHHQ